MYLVIVYDVGENRVNKVCKFLRQYLTWVQNSVFEGELTDVQLEKVKVGLKRIIDIDCDSILFYTVANDKWMNKQRLGIEKNSTSSLI